MVFYYVVRPTISYLEYKITLENTKGTITNGQSRETGNIAGYISRRKTKQKHNIICVGHNYSQTNAGNANKTCALLQTAVGKDEPNIVFNYLPGSIVIFSI